MSLEDLGNIGEFVAAVAVVVSLIYLAAQIRQNTKATRSSTFLGLTNAWQDYIFQTLQPTMTPLTEASWQDPVGMSAGEVTRFYLLTRVLFRRYENDFLQFKSKTLDRDAWEGYRKTFSEDFLMNPANRAMWQLSKHYFAPEFVRFVDKEIELARGLPFETLEEFEARWKAAVSEEFAAQLQRQPALASQREGEVST